MYTYIYVFTCVSIGTEPTYTHTHTHTHKVTLCLHTHAHTHIIHVCMYVFSYMYIYLYMVTLRSDAAGEMACSRLSACSLSSWWGLQGLSLLLRRRSSYLVACGSNKIENKKQIIILSRQPATLESGAHFRLLVVACGFLVHFLAHVHGSGSSELGLEKWRES
jgi:hypothetical protein